MSPEDRLKNISGEQQREWGRLWRDLDEEGKKPYVAMAHEDKARYEKEMKEWEERRLRLIEENRKVKAEVKKEHKN